MRKSTLFVSAVLTVFLMATMFGVVSAYQQVVKNNSTTSTQPSQNVLSRSVSVDIAPATTPTVTVPLVVTAEEATTIAIDFLGDPNVYSVEVVDYQGVSTYLVTFSSGALVYVNSEGVVVANTQMQPVVITASNPTNGGGGQANNSESFSGGNTHENNEHEEHEDHDD